MGVFCPCCGYETLTEERNYEICNICFWEDDPIQFENPFSDGANHISLLDAKQNFETIGACEARYVENVSVPGMLSIRDSNWMPYKEFITYIFRKELKDIEFKLESIITSNDSEELSKLRYYIEAYWEIDSEKAEDISLNLAYDERLKFLWPQIYRTLAENSTGDKIDDLFVEFLLEYRGKWPEIETIIDDYYRSI